MQLPMKKVLLTIGLACGLALTGYANLGDTLEQSCSRYGTPVSHNQNSYAFSWKHAAVSEWIDPANGKVGMICYIKHGTKITEQEYTAFCRANLPHYLEPDSEWFRESHNDADGPFTSLQSKDAAYFMQFGKDYTQHPYRAYLLICFSNIRDEAAAEWHSLRQ
jgi:hypothetical protein